MKDEDDEDEDAEPKEDADNEEDEKEESEAEESESEESESGESDGSDNESVDSEPEVSKWRKEKSFFLSIVHHIPNLTLPIIIFLIFLVNVSFWIVLKISF